MKEVKSGRSTLIVETNDDVIQRVLSDSYSFRTGVYGRQGSGKSTLANTHPGKKGVLSADCGLPVYSGDYELVSIPEPTKGQSKLLAWNMCEDTLEYFGKQPDIKVIIVDSATAVFTNLMYAIQANPTEMPTIPEYGKLRKASIEFIYKSFSYGKDVIFVFHELMEKDELSGRVWCNPLITGKLSAEIGRYFDEFYHMENSQNSKGVTYEILTQSTTMFSCKSRIASKAPDSVPARAPADLSLLYRNVKVEIKKKYGQSK